MIVSYFVHDLSGKITKTGRADEELVPLQGGPGLTVRLGEADDTTQKWDHASRGLVPLPVHVPDPAVELATRRAQMQLSPRQLFIGMAAAGVITPDEAVETAKTRNIPALVEGVVASLPLAEQTAVRVTWATMTVILRLDPMVALLGAAAGLTPEQIDDFFETFATV